MALFDLFKRKKPQPAAEDEPQLADIPLPEAVDSAAGTPPETAAMPPLPPAPKAVEPAPAASQPGRLRAALNRTRAFLATAFATDPTGLIDEDYFAELTDALVLADVGSELTAQLTLRIRRALADRGLVLKRDVPAVAQAVIAELLTAPPEPAPLDPDRLSVILLVGVNGSGKTTLAAKLAWRLRADGRSVLLAAADTFRAAAVEQLEIWAGRAGVEIVAGQTGADPAAVVFDAAQAARARGTEVLIIDTAGRLQTKHNLMAELDKITRTLDKALGDGSASPDGSAGLHPASSRGLQSRAPGAQIARILVLDATVGQNALSQALLFNECCPLTGLAVTKLDGTAKGGALLAVVDKLNVPVLYAGVGETLADLLDFDPQEFAAGLVGE